MTQPNDDDKPMDAYVRVSAVGERGGDESYGSPTVQREAIERWAEYQRVPLGRVYVDEDQSGGSQDRPGLVSAIERALSGQTGGFAVYNISRFSRFTEGGLRDLRRLEDANARVVFVQEQLDTSTVHGRMIFTILLATHEAALGQLKASWKVSKARAIGEGRQIGPTPPGYVRALVRNGHPKGSLVPDGARGQAITDAYGAVNREGDVRAAVPILAAAFPTKTFAVRKAKVAEDYARRLGRPVAIGEEVTVDATWNPSTARRVLQSRVYLGEAFYGDEIAANPTAHPPLIDGVTWRRVQKLIGIPEHRRRAPAGAYPLGGGGARCATCGLALIGGRMGTDPNTGVGRRSYLCNTNKRSDEAACSAPTRVLADPLEAVVRDLLTTHVRDLEDAAEPWTTLAEERAEGLTGAALNVADLDPTAGDWAVAEARKALAAAEAGVAEVEALRGTLPEAALAAALEAQDRAVHGARVALEVAQAGVPDEGGLPDAVEVSVGPTGALGEFLSAYGLVAEVKPALGDRRRGRVGERVSLRARV